MSEPSPEVNFCAKNFPWKYDTSLEKPLSFWPSLKPKLPQTRWPHFLPGRCITSPITESPFVTPMTQPPPNCKSCLELQAEELEKKTLVNRGVMSKMLSLEPDLLLSVGDLSYADGWAERWDIFGTLAKME